jgi:hypothetical protein
MCAIVGCVRRRRSPQHSSSSHLSFISHSSQHRHSRSLVVEPARLPFHLHLHTNPTHMPPVTNLRRSHRWGACLLAHQVHSVSWHSTYGISCSWPYVQHDASGCAQPRCYWMEGIHGRQSLQGNCCDSGRTSLLLVDTMLFVLSLLLLLWLLHSDKS